jgi:hypothetical protein
MTDFFLRLKHWQLFSIIVLIPVTLQMITFKPTLVYTFTVFDSFIFLIVMLFYIGGLMGWLYSVGTRINDILPNELKKNSGFFKFSVIFSTLYVVFFSIYSTLFRSNKIEPFVDESNFELFMFIVFPLHLFAMFCMFYCIYFASKTMKKFEYQKKIGFGDYAGEFFLMWFFPLGIWILQPKLNQINHGFRL